MLRLKQIAIEQKYNSSTASPIALTAPLMHRFCRKSRSSVDPLRLGATLGA
jgi:hypothetical protein